jgi:ribonuclease T2
MAKRLSLCIVTVCLTFLTISPASAQRRGRLARHTGQPGNFDYYLFTLSWSPEYCLSHGTSPECGSSKHFGFVVHGLWPQFESGSFPENCSNAPGPSNPSQFLNIMPDPGLIQHEWTTHGTCSGLSANDYFKLIQRAFQSLTIPSQFVAPASTIRMNPLQIKQAFEQANSGLKDGSIVINCAASYLKGVQVCLSKDLTPRPCSGVPDCTVRTVRVPPVR